MAMLNNQSIYILYYIYYIIYYILYIIYYILYIIYYILYIIYYKYIHSYSIWATSEVSFWLPRPPSSTPAMWPSSLVPPLDDFGDFYSNVYWFLWIFIDFYYLMDFLMAVYGCLSMFMDVFMYFLMAVYGFMMVNMYGAIFSGLYMTAMVDYNCIIFVCICFYLIIIFVYL